jgi:hypothetical protein
MANQVGQLLEEFPSNIELLEIPHKGDAVVSNKPR